MKYMFTQYSLLYSTILNFTNSCAPQKIARVKKCLPPPALCSRKVLLWRRAFPSLACIRLIKTPGGPFVYPGQSQAQILQIPILYFEVISWIFVLTDQSEQILVNLTLVKSLCFLQISKLWPTLRLRQHSTPLPHATPSKVPPIAVRSR